MNYASLTALAVIASLAASATPPPRPAITGVSHIALYTSDANATERFYVHDLGGLRGDDPENAAGVRYYFAPAQFVEVLPLPVGPASINRLDHVAFVTANAQRLREYLAARKIAVPKQIEQGRDGSFWFDVIDPEGNRIEFVQAPAQPPDVPVNALSSHIIHVGFIIHDRALEDTFYRSVLGFRPYWFGGMKDDVPTWVSQQVPEGTDWLEYMIVGTPEGRGIPVVEVIHPAVRAAVRQTRNKRVGVIGTVGTINSRAYDDAFIAASELEIFSEACPRFVEFVEAGITSGSELFGVAEKYLAPLIVADVDTLVLGCTHYPLLAGAIQYVMGENVTLVSSAEETAYDVYRTLVKHGIERTGITPPTYRFEATGDSQDEFLRLASRFLGPEVNTVDLVQTGTIPTTTRGIQ